MNPRFKMTDGTAQAGNTSHLRRVKLIGRIAAIAVAGAPATAQNNAALVDSAGRIAGRPFADGVVLVTEPASHIVAMWFIFASLVQSTLCLRWDEAGLKMRSKRVDRWSIVLFPALFLLWTGGLVAAGLVDAERDRGAGACGGTA